MKNLARFHFFWIVDVGVVCFDSVWQRPKCYLRTFESVLNTPFFKAFLEIRALGRRIISALLLKVFVQTPVNQIGSCLQSFEVHMDKRRKFKERFVLCAELLWCRTVIRFFESVGGHRPFWIINVYHFFLLWNCFDPPTHPELDVEKNMDNVRDQCPYFMWPNMYTQ